MGLSGGKRAWKSRRFCRVKKSGGIMAEENGGKRTGLLDRVRGDAEESKKIVGEKGKEEIEGLKDPEKTQLYRSIIRVKHEETPPGRSLGVLGDVFLPLREAEVRRDA